MKRSEINEIMRTADDFIRQHSFHLPPFAYWTPEQWQQRGAEVSEIVEQGLGWDITDFGLGDYARMGLFLFTLRNGRLANLEAGKGKVYAEKLMIVGVDQLTPLHFHWRKTEDIINRAGGKLVVQLYNSDPDGGLADTAVTVRMDGIERTLPAGGKVLLSPGESITLEPYCYHCFYAAESTVLIGEVSTVNDDNTDNRFYEPVGRFPDVEENERPLHLLVGDYANYWRSDR